MKNFLVITGVSVLLSSAAFAATATSVETEIKKGTDIIVKKSESVETGKTGKRLGTTSETKVTGATAVRGQERADLKLIDTAVDLNVKANTPLSSDTKCATAAEAGYDIAQKGKMIYIARSGITDTTTCAPVLKDVGARGNLVDDMFAMAQKSNEIHAMANGNIDETEALIINKEAGAPAYVELTGRKGDPEAVADFKQVESKCFGLKPVFWSRGAQSFD